MGSFFRVIIIAFLASVEPLATITILEKIINSDDYSTFNDLLRKSNYANFTIFTANLTVFVPNNDAFLKFSGALDDQLLYSHIHFGVKTLRSLEDGERLRTSWGSPPLWVTKNSDGVFVNNAKVLKKQSDHVVKNRHNGIEQIQVFHCIDEVLDPRLQIHPSEALKAIDFSNSSLWTIDGLSVDKIFSKIFEHGLSYLYDSDSANTYLLPIDECVTDNHLSNMDEQVLKSHVIPNQIAFTKAVKENYSYETMANEDYVYILAYFLEIDGRPFVKSYTLSGDVKHPVGEQYSEVILPNIPVANGVVHLISRPLVLDDEERSLFPFLPMHFKVSGDPTLNISYHLGEPSYLNQLLKNNNTQLTYFIPRDSAWRQFDDWERELLFSNTNGFFGRHLVVSDTPYSMKVLELHSRQPNNSEILLNSVGGVLALKVRKVEEKYFIHWKNRVISVYRPDYQCTNGVVHVIDSPFVSGEDFIQFISSVSFN